MSSGTYGPNFFGYSVNHDIESSRNVLGKLSGNFEKNSAKWMAASESDKRIFLTEKHEAAHHHLISSTPCGVLLWHLNQVIHRDIDWLLRKIAEVGINLPSVVHHRDYFHSVEFERALRLAPCIDGIKLYINCVISNIDNCLTVRDLFFGPRAPLDADFQSITMGNLAERLNKAFSWMSVRCAIPWNQRWLVKGDPNSKVFNASRPINIHDIAEAHAIANELSILRSFGDVEGFNNRFQEITKTSYAAGVLAGIEGLPNNSDAAFSPSLLRHRALMACCTNVDLVCSGDAKEDIYVEAELPWVTYVKMEVFNVSSHRNALENLERLVSKPFHGPDAGWSNLRDMHDSSDASVMISNMVWLGLDLQVYGMHTNAKTLIQYIMDYLENKPFCYDLVSNKAIESQYLVEYEDEVDYIYKDLESIYGKTWSTLKKLGFERLNYPSVQLICHLINGATVRNTIAHYLQEQIPGSSIIELKLKQHLHSSDADVNIVEKGLGRIIKILIENGKFGEEDSYGYLVNNKGRFIN